jgi:serine/threonine-protein kinase HipA
LPAEDEGRYHAKCLKALWGRAEAPRVPFAARDLPEKVAAAGEHMSISGVQMKALVRLGKGGSEVEFAPAGSTHILKPEPNEYPDLPAMENLCMAMAAVAGLAVEPHGLFPMSDGGLCYVIRRFDRTGHGGRIQSETMFQLLGSTDKYEGSLEAVGKAIRVHAENVGLDAVEFFERVLFCFLTGNGDMHMKNWAFIIEGKKVRLAPCYDFVCSKAYVKGEEDSALAINARKNRLKRSDFDSFGASLKIAPKTAANSFEKMRSSYEKLRRMAERSELSPLMRQEIEGVMAERFGRLFAR